MKKILRKCKLQNKRIHLIKYINLPVLIIKDSNNKTKYKMLTITATIKLFKAKYFPKHSINNIKNLLNNNKINFHIKNLCQKIKINKLI